MSTIIPKKKFEQGRPLVYLTAEKSLRSCSIPAMEGSTDSNDGPEPDDDSDDMSMEWKRTSNCVSSNTGAHGFCGSMEAFKWPNIASERSIRSPQNPVWATFHFGEGRGTNLYAFRGEAVSVRVPCER